MFFKHKKKVENPNEDFYETVQIDQADIQDEDYPRGNYRLDKLDQEENYPSRQSRHREQQRQRLDALEKEVSQVYYQSDDYEDEQNGPKKRAKYSAKVDRFLNSGIIIVGVLLVGVLLVAFLV